MSQGRQKLPEGEQQISLIISKGVPYMNKGNLWGVGKLNLLNTHYNQVVLNTSHEQYFMILI